MGESPRLYRVTRDDLPGLHAILVCFPGNFNAWAIYVPEQNEPETSGASYGDPDDMRTYLARSLFMYRSHAPVLTLHREHNCVIEEMHV